MLTGLPPRPRALGSTVALLACLMVLAGCAISTFDAGRRETVLPLHRAWVDGHLVEYVTTDVSDAAMARAAGVNHVPRLRDALPAPGRPSVVERVYKFAGQEQISVFQSAPRPAGGDNADAGYSPLWRLTWVRWALGAVVRELKSEEELLAAQDQGLLTLELTDIVVNCPVTRSADGRRLQGAR